MSDRTPLDSLPPGWSWAQLEHVTASEPNAMTDGPFGSKLKTEHYTGSGVRVIRLGNLGAGRFINDDCAYVSPEHYESLRKHEAHPGDLLIAALAEPVGRCCRVPTDLGTAIVKADCIRLKPHPSLSPEFVMNWLNSPPGRRQAEEACHGIGRLRMNMADMRALLVPVAPEREQNRIVAKIETLNARSRAARDALEQVPLLLERFRQSVLAAAFRGDLTAEWRRQHPDVEPASVLLERIRAVRRRAWGRRYEEPEPFDSAGLPDLPVGWCWANLIELLDAPLGNGLSIKGSDTPPGIASLKLSAMTEDGFDYTKVKFLPVDPSDVEHLLVREDDFFVSRGNGSKALVARGTVAQPTPFPVIFPDLMIRVRLSDELRSTRWIPAIWPAPQTRRQIEARVKTTAGIWKISQADLGRVVVPLPPLQEQVAGARAVAASLSWARRQEDLAQQTLAGLARLDLSILATAYRGELVPQDPNDEPASVLLDRIRAEREAAGAGGARARRGRRARSSEAEVSDDAGEPDDAPAPARASGTNGNGSTLHAVLGALKREALHRIADAEGVELADRRSLDGARAGLSEGDVTLEAVVGHLDRDELKAVCRALGLEDRGRTKVELRNRITGGARR